VRRLVLASDNPGKLREFSALLAPLAVDVLPQGQLGINAAEEPHATFVENALAKARHAATASGLPALADDSGLCCEALAGAPGVRSARFAGEPADDARNNEELLRRLSGESNRRAHYVCVLVLCRHGSDPEPLIAEGRWHGRIAFAPRGAGGFGYDPLFELPERGVTVAELASAEKNRISHRALALQDLAGRLRAAGQW
jgi:XTP/dITP diphosphohydrolase